MSASFFRRVFRSESGNAMVELAVALPVLVLTLVGTVDFARIFYTSIELTNAARAGAQYGAANLGNSGNYGAMESTATGAVNITGVTAVASRLCQCADSSGTLTPTSGGANNCIALVTVSCPGLHRVMTVTVTTSKTFTSVAANVPGIPTSILLNRTATLRVSE
jgi:Flp pilus assembly protein TadG